MTLTFDTPRFLRDAKPPWWMQRIARLPEAAKLCRAIAWSEGFSFHVAGCGTPEIAAAVQLWLAECVAVEREQPVTTERVSPYPLDWREPDPALICAGALADLVIEQLVGTSNHADVIFLDGARAREGEADAWRAMFGMLNRARNRVAREIPSALVLVLPLGLVREFAKTAVDFWSIRSSFVDFGNLTWREDGRNFCADHELLARARAGDSNAGAILYRLHAPWLRKYLAVLNVFDPDEVIQDAFMSLLTSNIVVGSVRSQLFGAARLHARRNRRRNRSHDLIMAGINDTDAPPQPSSPIEDMNYVTDLSRAIDRLRFDLREIVHLQLTDLSLHEIAETLDLPLATIARRRRKAIQTLRALLGDDEGIHR